MMARNADPEDKVPNAVAMVPILKRTGLVLVFLWFMIGGVAHFSFTEAEMRIVPPSIPWPRAANQSIV